MFDIYGKLSSHQIDASIAETATDRLVHAVPTSGRTALQLAQCKNDRGLSAAKRVFDVSAAAAALVIVAPLFAALALVVCLVIDKPILFKQQRRRAFTIYKFRTMSNARNAEGRSLPDAERLGWFGKFLRSTRLDELPELINVLRDEMSIVGPRPLLTEYLPRYSAEQMRRHDVLPGITVSSEPFMGNVEAAQSGARIIEREPTTVLVTRGGNAVGQPLIKAARSMALPCRIVDTDCDKLPVEKSEAQGIQIHGGKSGGAVQTLRTSNAAEWNAVLSKTHQHDFYHLPQYYGVAEQHDEGIARLFLYSENEYTIALPLLLRLVDTNKPEGWTDATSIYGYAGPVASHEWLPESFLQTFQGTLRDELSCARVVSVFSRLHPVIPRQEMLAGLGECVENGQTISSDLSWPGKEQRSHCKNDCRRRLRKLREAGFVCVHDRENRYLREFVEVYHETMSRVQAEQSYFFDPTYFSDLAKSLGRALKLFVVKMPDGEVISGGLFTLCEGIVQYHLGGTPNTALKLSPIVLLLDTVRRGANENGAHTFHLGGGGGAKTDSLFQFKANFSRRRHEFVTWRWIVAPETYRELSRQKQLSNSERGLRAISPSFFPAYRCPSEPDAVPAALRAPAPAMAAPAEIQVAQNG